MSIVVVGCHSMIGRVLQQNPKARDWSYMSHQQVFDDPEMLRDATCIINFAFDPRMKSQPYDEALDVDLRLAHLLTDCDARYVMSSTRMAYGPAQGDGRLVETMPEQPNTYYGASKLACETRVRSLLGDRLTVLRLSNIFDASEAEGSRRSFFGLAMRKLRDEGQIFFDMSPFVQRDFLPAALLAERIITIAKQPVPGVFNLGAGFPVATGRIAQWLIEGFGAGNLVVGDFREFDAFYLDVRKATDSWGFDTFSERELRGFCLTAGATIAHEECSRAELPIRSGR